MGSKREVISLEDRRNIQGGLDHGLKVSEIARNLNRSQGTVRDEIKRHMTANHPGYTVLENRNVCAKREACMFTRNSWACPMRETCRERRGCKTCRYMNCNDSCPSFEAAPCPKREKSPFVCNGCSMLQSDCGHIRGFYIAEIADDEASGLRKSARRQRRISDENFKLIDEAVTYGYSRNQSLDAILMANPWMTGLVSVSTLYRWQEEGRFTAVTKLDSVEAMKRRVRKRGPKGQYAHSCIAKEDLKGRTYEDFKKLPEAEQDAVVQMDTVKGRLGVDRKCILTFQWKRFHFQLYILLPDCTAASVTGAMDKLQAIYGESYGKWFGTIITDQGAEFSDVVGMEVNKLTGEIRSSVFFCDPYRSQQKPNCERQHEELRDILPKGKTSFDALRPNDLVLITSHVNSYPLRTLSGMSALDFIWPCMGAELSKLGIERIEKRDVCKSPWLVPHAMIEGTQPGKKPVPATEGNGGKIA